MSHQSKVSDSGKPDLSIWKVVSDNGKLFPYSESFGARLTTGQKLDNLVPDNKIDGLISYDHNSRACFAQ
jgi:hypothetical protein